MKLLIIIAIGVALSSCTVRYYTPKVTPVAVNNAGELRVSGNFGTSIGGSITYAPTESMAFHGSYNTFSIEEYRGQEAEFGGGLLSLKDNGSSYIGGGVGFGNNYGFSDSTGSTRVFKGDIIRPFLQFNVGANGTSSEIKFLPVDVYFNLRASYLMYDGHRIPASDGKIKSEYLLLEPGLYAGFGGSWFQFDVYFSVPFRPAVEPLGSNDARTFFITTGVGLSAIIGRD